MRRSIRAGRGVLSRRLCLESDRGRVPRAGTRDFPDLPDGIAEPAIGLAGSHRGGLGNCVSRGPLPVLTDSLDRDGPHLPPAWAPLRTTATGKVDRARRRLFRLTRDARSAHEIAGDHLVNLVWTLLDQQAS